MITTNEYNVKVLGNASITTNNIDDEVKTISPETIDDDVNLIDKFENEYVNDDYHTAEAEFKKAAAKPEGKKNPWKPKVIKNPLIITDEILIPFDPVAGAPKKPAPKKKQTSQNKKVTSGGGSRQVAKAQAIEASLRESEAKIDGALVAESIVEEEKREEKKDEKTRQNNAKGPVEKKQVIFQLPEGKMWAFNYMMYESGHESREINVVCALDYAEINGQVVVMADDAKAIINGRITYLTHADVIEQYSSNGLFVVVERRNPMVRRPVYRVAEQLMLADGRIFRFVGGPIENLRYTCYLTVEKYITDRMIADRRSLISQICRVFKREYGKLANIEGEVSTILEEPWVEPKIQAYLNSRSAENQGLMRKMAFSIASKEYRSGVHIVDLLKWALKSTVLVGVSSLATIYGFKALFSKPTNPTYKISMESINGYYIPVKTINTVGGLAWWQQLFHNNFARIGVPLSVAGLWASSLYYVYNTYPQNYKSMVVNNNTGDSGNFNFRGQQVNYGTDPVEEVLNEFKTDLKRKPFMVTCAMKRIFKSPVVDREYPLINPSVSLVVEKPVVEKPTTSIESFGTTIVGAPMVIPKSGVKEIEAAVRIRMAFDRKQDDTLVAEMLEFCKAEIDKMPHFYLEPMPIDQFVKSQYTGLRAQQILNADDEIGYDDIWAELFVKLEAYLGKDWTNFKPRMIWKRSDACVKKFGPSFKSLGDLLKKYFDGNNSDVLYASGVTPDVVGRYARKLETLPYIYEIDVSNWDGSMSSAMLELEKYFLQTKVHGWPQEADWLFDNWSNVWGRARGLKYKANYGRRSGDLWTSPLNTFINQLISKFIFKKLCALVFVMLILGDDGVVSCDKRVAVADIVDLYARIGMKAEVSVHDDMSSVTFCSGRFWKVSGSYVWGNMPFRQWAKFALNYHGHSPKLFKRLLYGIAKGLLCSAGHIPIFGTFLRAICNTAEKAGLIPFYDNSHLNPYRIQGGGVYYPSSDTYEQFAQIYGMSTAVIQLYETMIEQEVTIDSFPAEIVDDNFLRCFEIDVPNDSMHEGKWEVEYNENYVVNLAPILEETQKMKRMRVIGLVQACKEISDQEIADGSPRYVELLHLFFGSVSTVSLTTGIKLHSYWNWMALKVSGDQVVACAKGAKKSGRRKPPPRKRVVKPRKQGIDNNIKKLMKNVVKEALMAGGGILGGAVGGPGGVAVGRSAGEFFSRITGMGDYKISRNSLTNGQAPSFGSHSTRVKHSEFITDVTSSIPFVVNSYPINPGLDTTFPWLSSLARAYETYTLEGMVWTYKPTSGVAVNGTNPALGVVVISTQYDPSQPSFGSKREMEAYMFTTSCAPDAFMCHPVECKRQFNPLDEYFIRYDDTITGTDLRWNDIGHTCVGVVGTPATGNIIGELWLSYDIVFSKPRLYSGPVTTNDYAYYNINTVSGANPLGSGSTALSPTFYSGQLTDVLINQTTRTITLSESLSGYYAIGFNWGGSSAAVITWPTFTFVNVTRLVLYENLTSSRGYAPVNGTTATRMSYEMIAYTSLGTIGAINFDTSGILPGGTNYLTITITPAGPLEVEEFDTFEDRLSRLESLVVVDEVKQDEDGRYILP